MAKGKEILSHAHGGELPPGFQQLRLPKIDRHHKLEAEDQLTPEEISAIRDAATSLRDKTKIEMLAGTGARLTAFTIARVGDVIEKGGVLRLRVRHGKTGSRNYFIAPRVVPWLRRWLATFPRDSQHRPLWPKHREPHRAITPHALYMMLKRLAEKAGI